MTISFVQELAFGRQVIGIETDSVSGQKRRVIRLGGLINNALVNKLSNAQAFNLWTLSAMGATVDATTAPDGSTTADLLIPTAVSTNHIAFQSYAKPAVAEVHTFSLFAKASGLNFVVLRVDDGGGVNFAQVAFDVLNGVSSNSNSGGTAALQSSFVIPAGNGWFFIGISVLTSTGASVRDLAYVSNTANIVGLGDGVSGAYLWQGQSVFGPISGPINFVL